MKVLVSMTGSNYTGKSTKLENYKQNQKNQIPFIFEKKEIGIKSKNMLILTSLDKLEIKQMKKKSNKIKFLKYLFNFFDIIIEEGFFNNQYNKDEKDFFKNNNIKLIQLVSFFNSNLELFERHELRNKRKFSFDIDIKKIQYNLRFKKSFLKAKENNEEIYLIKHNLSLENFNEFMDSVLRKFIK